MNYFVFNRLIKYLTISDIDGVNIKYNTDSYISNDNYLVVTAICSFDVVLESKYKNTNNNDSCKLQKFK